MLTFCGKCKAMGNFKKSMSCWHFMKERIAMHIWFISWTLRAEVYVQKKAIQMYRTHIWVMTNLLEICSAPKNMFIIFYVQNYFAYFIVRSKYFRRKNGIILQSIKRFYRLRIMFYIWRQHLSKFFAKNNK